MADLQTALRQKQSRMREIEAQYLRTKEFLKSSEWHVKRDEVLIRMTKAMAGYNPVIRPGQDAVAAVYVLGQAKMILEEIQEITDCIVEYEALKAELERYAERSG